LSSFLSSILFPYTTLFRSLIHRFNWMFYVLGGFLILTGIKMVFFGNEEVHPEKNIVVRLTRKLFPVAADFDGQRLITTLNGRRADRKSTRLNSSHVSISYA